MWSKNSLITSPIWTHSKKSVNNPKQNPHIRICTWWYFDIRLQATRITRNKHFLFLSYQVHCTLLLQLERNKQMIHTQMQQGDPRRNPFSCKPISTSPLRWKQNGNRKKKKGLGLEHRTVNHSFGMEICKQFLLPSPWTGKNTYNTCKHCCSMWGDCRQGTWQTWWVLFLKACWWYTWILATHGTNRNMLHKSEWTTRICFGFSWQCFTV